MVSGEKEFSPKSDDFFCNLALKYTISLKYPNIHGKYINTTLKLLSPLISWNVYKQKNADMRQKRENLQPNTACLEQQIYSSLEFVYTNAVPDVLDI